MASRPNHLRVVLTITIVETGIRNLMRTRPLEVEEATTSAGAVRVPTLAETARIKAWLCLMRNATRDYLDFVALTDRMGTEETISAVLSLDDFYRDQIGPEGQRIATQLAKQLAEPRPDDLSDVDLNAYRELDRRWRDWGAVTDACRRIAVGVLDRVAEEGSS